MYDVLGERGRGGGRWRGGGGGEERGGGGEGGGGEREGEREEEGSIMKYNVSSHHIKLYFSLVPSFGRVFHCAQCVCVCVLVHEWFPSARLGDRGLLVSCGPRSGSC